MGSGRGCHPILPIFTLSIEVLKTFVFSEFCYYSFSSLGDMHIKSIRGGTTTTFYETYELHMPLPNVIQYTK